MGLVFEEEVLESIVLGRWSIFLGYLVVSFRLVFFWISYKYFESMLMKVIFLIWFVLRGFFVDVWIDKGLYLLFKCLKI